jgi:mannose-6-phosphate isomerase-like protein (cupin superfamily)
VPALDDLGKQEGLPMTTEAGFRLADTYVFLEDGGRAPTVPGGDAFWRELVSGAPRSPGVRRVAEGDGWLAVIAPMTADAPTSEMHPAGDELLVLLSGEVDVVLEALGGDRVVGLAAGTACIVPRGTWHRQVVHTPGDLLAVTYGKGTQHRPVGR